VSLPRSSRRQGTPRSHEAQGPRTGPPGRCPLIIGRSPFQVIRSSANCSTLKHFAFFGHFHGVNKMRRVALRASTLWRKIRYSPCPGASRARRSSRSSSRGTFKSWRIRDIAVSYTNVYKRPALCECAGHAQRREYSPGTARRHPSQARDELTPAAASTCTFGSDPRPERARS